MQDGVVPPRPRPPEAEEPLVGVRSQRSREGDGAGRLRYGIGFERYVDDAVVHCVSESRARTLLVAIEERMREAGLELHDPAGQLGVDGPACCRCLR